MCMMRRIAARIGMFWYVVPSLFVVVLGVATCSLIDVPEFDRFEVVSSVADRSGVRSAVLVHQHHSDSSAYVTCLLIIAGTPPAKGPSPRLAPSCALIATDTSMPITLSWQPNGRPVAALPRGATLLRGQEKLTRCYFEAEALQRHVCYRPEMIDVETTR